MLSFSLRRFHSLVIVPALLPFLFLISPSASNNHLLTAVDANYTVHSILYGSFPFSDPIYLVSNGPVSHGTLRTFGRFNGYSQDSFIYYPDYGYVGADSFTYHACDSSGNCIDGTINLNVVNSAPNAVAHSYDVRGGTLFVGPPSLLEGDSDPDGDPFSVVSYTQASHGTVTYFYQYDILRYDVFDPSYTGTDSFTYRICDNLGLCAEATVTLNVSGEPTPTPTPTPTPVATPTPTPPPPPPPPPPSPTPTPTPTEPLIFIPGIAGSKLDEVGGGNVWPSLFFDINRLTLDPQEQQRNIFVPDVIRTATFLFGRYTEQVYTPLLKELSNEGYREYKVNNDPTRRTTAGCDLTQKHDDPSDNPNLFVFAYDWRKSIADNAPLLRDYVGCVQMFYPNTKVNILAHSMGGLLARRYIIDNPGTHKVNKLITIATPWLGAPKAIHVLETGNFFNKFILDSVFAADMKKLIEFFPGAHQTLPGRSYFKLGGRPFGEATWDYNKNGRLDPTYDTTADSGYVKLVSALDLQHPRSKPGTLDTQFHDKTGQDDWRGDQSGVQYYHIYGVQKLPRTIGKAIAISETICDSPGVNCRSVNGTKFEKVYGDGTAPLLSTERIGNGLNLNAPGSIKIPFTSTKPADDDSYEHTFLTQNPAVWAAIRTALSPASPQQAKAPSPKSRAIILAHHKVNARSAFTLDDQPTQVEGAPGYYLHATGIDFINVSDALRYSFDGSHFLAYTEPLLIDPAQTPSVFAFADDNVANRSAISTYAVPRAPSITAPPNLVVNTGSNAVACGVTIGDNILGTATASSNSSGTVTVTRVGVPSGSFFSVGTTSVIYTATDTNGLTATATQSVTVTDNTPPVLSCPANIVLALPLNSTATSTTLNYSTPTVSDNCPGPISIASTPVSGSVFQVGTTSVSASATDAVGNASSCDFTVTVLYDFSGFFSPVGNLPVLNTVNAGRALPIKFSLSGNKGLNVFATVPNNPSSGLISCDATAPAVDITETVAAGNSSLSYDAASDQYTYVWKTDSSWVGTCRQLMLQLSDGSIHRANFKFK